MNTIRLSATSARNNFFELLNQVALGTHVIIERDNKEVAILSPKKPDFNWKKFQKAAKAVKGILKDYTPEEIAPVRYYGKWTLGMWDKELPTNNQYARDKKRKSA